MAETSQATDTRAEFADIICADAEWVRAEFDQIVSGLARVRTAIAAPRFQTDGDRRLWHLTTPARIPRPQTLPERVRAPPAGMAAARPSLSMNITRTACHSRRSLEGDSFTMSMSFDPFSQLDRIAQSVFDTSRQPRLMPVDLFREGDRYVLNADLPGVDPGSVDVDVDGHLLTIRAERTEANRDNSRWLAQERPFGSYVRRFTIGDDVDAQGIHATYSNGVLSVVIPIAERAKPRKIQIESIGSHDAKAVTA